MGRKPTVIVIGGGLAGLVTARHLAAAGADVTIFERREAVGGRVRTLERDGFRFDRGFQVLLTAYPAVRTELDLEDLDLRRFAPGATIARAGHRSTLSDPLRDPRALPATLFNTDVSVGDKLRVVKLRRRLSRTEPDVIFSESNPDTSIDRYLREAGFSDRFVENFAAPFYGGITLDRSLSTSKRVFEYTFRMLSSGSTAVPAAGMGAISAQLARNARAAGVTLETGAEVTSVSADDTDTDDAIEIVVDTGRNGRETVAADAAVVATDPRTARDLTGVESIPTAARGCVTQYCSLPAGTDLETGKRLLLNAAVDDGPNHVVPHSEVAPEYAPDDAELISATYLEQSAGETGGERTEGVHRESTDGVEGESVNETENGWETSVDEEVLFERTRGALESWYPERRFDALELLHTDRIPFAQFAQPPGIHDRLPGPRARNGRVYLAGEYTQWSSIQGALESGRAAAKAVVQDLE